MRLQIPCRAECAAATECLGLPEYFGGSDSGRNRPIRLVSGQARSAFANCGGDCARGREPCPVGVSDVQCRPVRRRVACAWPDPRGPAWPGRGCGSPVATTRVPRARCAACTEPQICAPVPVPVRCWCPYGWAPGPRAAPARMPPARWSAHRLVVSARTGAASLPGIAASKAGNRSRSSSSWWCLAAVSK